MENYVFIKDYLPEDFDNGEIIKAGYKLIHCKLDHFTDAWNVFDLDENKLNVRFRKVSLLLERGYIQKMDNNIIESIEYKEIEYISSEFFDPITMQIIEMSKINSFNINDFVRKGFRVKYSKKYDDYLIDDFHFKNLNTLIDKGLIFSCGQISIEQNDESKFLELYEKFKDKYVLYKLC